jgi:hypothetical protein
MAVSGGAAALPCWPGPAPTSAASAARSTPPPPPPWSLLLLLIWRGRITPAPPLGCGGCCCANNNRGGLPLGWHMFCRRAVAVVSLGCRWIPGGAVLFPLGWRAANTAAESTAGGGGRCAKRWGGSGCPKGGGPGRGSWCSFLNRYESSFMQEISVYTQKRRMGWRQTSTKKGSAAKLSIQLLK